MCTNADDRFFFYPLHPSAHAHYQIAMYICEKLQAQGIACLRDVVQPLVQAEGPEIPWF